MRVTTPTTRPFLVMTMPGLIFDMDTFVGFGRRNIGRFFFAVIPASSFEQRGGVRARGQDSFSREGVRTATRPHHGKTLSRMRDR